MIPKNIFMIWLGDKIPSYVEYSMAAFFKANPDFNIKLVSFSIADIKRVYNNDIRTINEQILKNSIDDILNYKKDRNLINENYAKLIDNQIICYGKNIVFIQLLSDVLRLKLINFYGGIYVDCDTFPIKPFDEQLLSIHNFITERHYDTKIYTQNDYNLNLGTDNYFIGGEIDSILKWPVIHIRQTNNNWWINPLFIYRKKRFFNNSLTYVENKKSEFYIEHYCDGNWKEKNGRIRTQLCFLDDLYKK